MKRFLGVVGLFLCVLVVRGADVDDLIKQLQSGDNEERRLAAKALGEGGAESKAAVPALMKALKDRDTFVRRFSAQALGDIGPDARPAVFALAVALDDPKKEVQSAAAHALGKLGPSGIETLIEILRDDGNDPMLRLLAIDVLSTLGHAGRSAVPALTQVLKPKTGKNSKPKAPPADLRVPAAVALGSLAKAGDTQTVAALEAFTAKNAKARATSGEPPIRLCRRYAGTSKTQRASTRLRLALAPRRLFTSPQPHFEKPFLGPFLVCAG